MLQKQDISHCSKEQLECYMKRPVGDQNNVRWRERLDVHCTQHASALVAFVIAAGAVNESMVMD